MKKATRRTMGRTVACGIRNGKWVSDVEDAAFATTKKKFLRFGDTAICGDEEYGFFYYYKSLDKVKKEYYGITSYQAKSDLENGFSREDPESDRLIKYVSPEDLDFVFEKETSAAYNGDAFAVEAIEGREICLRTSDCDLAKKHGMEGEKGAYRIRVSLNEVEEITQNWIPLDARDGSIPADDPQTKGCLRTSGKTAIYNNTEYEFFYDAEQDRCAIVSHRVKSDLENGFSVSDHSRGRLFKHVSLSDLDFVFDKKMTAVYDGDRFKLHEIKGKEAQIDTLDCVLGRKHNMEERFYQGLFCLDVSLEDLSGITQKWIPLDRYNKQIFAPAEKEAKGGFWNRAKRMYRK